jgi:hypothetical protein
MDTVARKELLRKRIAFALVDDEEYLEEVYVDVNFSIEEQGREKPPKLLYVRHRCPFRLTEVLEALSDMVADGLVCSRAGAGYADCCGLASSMFRLTPLGERFWSEEVDPVVDKIFEGPGE